MKLENIIIDLYTAGLEQRLQTTEYVEHYSNGQWPRLQQDVQQAQYYCGNTVATPESLIISIRNAEAAAAVAAAESAVRMSLSE